MVNITIYYKTNIYNKNDLLAFNRYSADIFDIRPLIQIKSGNTVLLI